MGCGCFSKDVDQVAPSHKPYVVPPGDGSASAPQRKNESRWSATQASVAGPKSPASSSSTAKPESSFDAALLAQGSQVQGLLIVPWDEGDEDVASNFGLAHSHGGAHFEDADGLLSLSARQTEGLQLWQRFPELVRLLKRASNLQPEVLASPPSSRVIRQGLVGDCSFLSALSVLAEYERRFGEPVVSSIIYPKGSGGKPVYNEYGQYACRLYLNGTMRKVVVDDRVPVRGNGQMLCAHSMTPHELWVTILEKSFAKIMGSSYDMQGSNPGTDVFHLTGWVPETIPLAGLADRGMTAWHDIFGMAEHGYRDGRCILCVGTSEIADAVPDDLARQLGHVEGVSVSTGLVARHAYPVLDCRQFGQHRILRLKNPWGKIRWRGRFAPGDTASWKDLVKAVHGSSGFLVETFGYDPASNTSDDGLFWIAWEDVLKYFSHLYLCWAPPALGHRMEVHGCWNAEPHFARSLLPDDTHLVAFNPQFHLRLHEPLPAGADGDTGGIWVLLSRHVKIRAEISTRYVAAHIYEGSSRLCCPDAPKEMGVYSNGECALVRLGSAAGRGQTDFVLVVSQHAHKVAFNFTLHVYSAVPGTLTPLLPLVPDSYVSGSAEGCWTEQTAGGCSNDMWAYFKNPHWRLDIPTGGLEVLALFLECPAEYSVNVRLFVGGVAHPECLRSAESSGAYRQGCCVLRLESIPPGPHVVVVSTFRSGLIGSYRMSWHASQAIELRPHPHPFAAPLQPPLECLARLVTKGVRTRLRIIPQLLDVKTYESSQFYSQTGSLPQTRKTLLSARLQCDFKAGLPPLLRLLRDSPGAAGSNPQAGDATPLQPAAHVDLKESYAESYFNATGAAVLLLAELLPGESFVLELLASEEGNGSNALYITSDGPLDLEDITVAGDRIVSASC